MPWALSETGPKVSIATITPTVVSRPQPASATANSEIESEPVPTLVYSRRKHMISVFALPRPTAVEPSASSQTINGYNLVRWGVGNVEYWAASDLNPKELDAFAGLFQKASAGR